MRALQRRGSWSPPALLRRGAATAARPRAAPAVPHRAVSRCAALALDEASAHVLEVPVYIEFTDCFQVTYYANYWRFFAYGREAALGAPLLSSLGARPVVLGLAGGRLASPALLGDTLAVRSHVIGCDADARTLTWRHSVAPAGAPPGTKPHAACDVTLAFAAPGATALLPLPPALLLPGLPASPALPPLCPYADNPSVARTIVLPFADELGPGGRPSETDVLRWFERNRTDAIGGAAGLRALQAAGVLVVVTGVGPMRLDPLGLAAAARSGGALCVRSGVQLRRRGTFIVFRQEVYGSVGGDEREMLLAQGEVTCACVAAADMKLAPAPPDLAARLAAAAGGAA